MTRQQDFEKAMLDEGRVEYLETVRKAQASGHEAFAPYGRQLLNGIIEPLALALRTYADRKRGRGKPSVADTYLQIFSAKKKATAKDGAEALVYILSKLVIERMSKPRRFVAVAVAVGKAIEREVRREHEIRLKKRRGSVNDSRLVVRHMKAWTPKDRLL